LQEKFVTVADPALFGGQSVKFEVGGVVAGRYRILDNLGDTNLGCVFHARDQARTEDVKLIVLHPSVALNGEVLSALERSVEKLIPRPHANVVRVDALETVGDRTFLVLEWFEGASLVELLRAGISSKQRKSSRYWVPSRWPSITCSRPDRKRSTPVCITS
jgi:serine/threonine protein kinase